MRRDLRTRARVVRSAIAGGWAGLRLLLNPKRVEAVLALGDRLAETRAFAETVAALKASPEGAARVRERFHGDHPPLDFLAGLPADSLGGAYARHLRGCGIEPYARLALPAESERVYVRERLREAHDILHAVLEYGIDVDDEAALNAVVVAQLRAPTSVLILVGVVLRALFREPARLGEVLERMREGYVRGRAAEPLLAFPWEDHWSAPIADLRARLGVQPRYAVPLGPNLRPARDRRLNPNPDPKVRHTSATSLRLKTMRN